ncbi:MAG: DUF1080 domain-containing protein [Verrucomicrobiales bacterium]|nr:DUF1080 domain-containing protein [Verrucomicrobiales bacterium]
MRPLHPVPTSAVVLGLVLHLLGQCSSSSQTAPASVQLFDGRTLNGWYTWLVDTRHDDPRHVFTVTNGWLRISGDGLGYLATRKAWADYTLKLEWRWGETNTRWGDRIGKARDSGVFLNATGPDGNSHDGNGAFMAAIECNLFEGACGDILLIRGDHSDGTAIEPRITAEVAAAKDAEGWFTWLSGGRSQTLRRWGRLNWFGKSPQWQDATGFRGLHDLEKPFGEWNHLECENVGGQLRLKLNGVLVNEARDIYPTSGKILLQCEGSEIFFRELTLHPHPEPLSPGVPQHPTRETTVAP